MEKKRNFIFFFLGLAVAVQAQAKDSIAIKNKYLCRQFTIEADTFYTSSFKSLITGEDYSRQGTEEFFFSLQKDEKRADVNNSSFAYVKHDYLVSANGDQKLTVFLKGKKGTVAEKVDVELVYEIYDEFPVVRKKISIRNHSGIPVAVTGLEVERLNLVPLNTWKTDIYSHYGTHLSWRPFRGDHHDAAVYVYNTVAKDGFILGNEAPGVLKRTEVYTHNEQISIGLTGINDHYPFKKLIAPGEAFSSPGTFIFLVQSKKVEDAFEGDFAGFIRKKLGVRLFEKKEIPFAFYNTWYPFRTNISDTLMYDIADGLHGTGTDLVILDDGWMSKWGDLEADRKKFPGGLKPVCDYIRGKGMLPGLWISLATVDAKSKIVQQHPEWLVLGSDGKPVDLHGDTKDRYTMSLGSGYYDYILKGIKHLVRENRLAYVKLDLTIANSAYVLDFDKKGDYGSEGKIYSDRASSFYAIYERAMKLFDELHKDFPDLLIDCTYEVWGEYYVSDFALIQHADYDWLTNYEADPPEGPVSIRQMSYDRARVIPAATSLIGNQQMYTSASNPAVLKNYKYTYMSLVSGKPILVGDPRNLTADTKMWYSKWNSWFKMMDKKYQFSRFTQTSDIFPRATMSNWDGCYKFNKEKQGGVLFFYRNGSLENTRTFEMPLVDKDVKYRLYSPEDGKIVGSYQGKELIEKGITITIPDIYEAKVLGIERTD